MRGDNAVDFDEPLGVSGGLEPPHSPLALTGRLMRVLGTIVQVPVLPVSNSRHHYSLRCPVATELISNNHPWPSLTGCPQEPAEEADGGETIPLRLDENIKNDTILIDGPRPAFPSEQESRETSGRATHRTDRVPCNLNWNALASKLCRPCFSASPDQ